MSKWGEEQGGGCPGEQKGHFLALCVRHSWFISSYSTLLHLAPWPWQSWLTILNLAFLICKMNLNRILSDSSVGFFFLSFFGERILKFVKTIASVVILQSYKLYQSKQISSYTVGKSILGKKLENRLLIQFPCNLGQFIFPLNFLLVTRVLRRLSEIIYVKYLVKYKMLNKYKMFYYVPRVMSHPSIILLTFRPFWV